MMHGRDREQQRDHAASRETHQADVLRGPQAAAQQPRTSLLRLQQRAGNRAVQRLLQRTQQEPAVPEVTPDVTAGIQQARGGGQPLDAQLRAQFEPVFGTNFSQVRVHTDTRADTLSRAISARAFATGSDLFFRQGAYQPGSSSGRALLAHELTHVVQQQGATIQTALTVSQPGDRFEQEAEHVAQAIMQHEQASPASAIRAAGPSIARMAQASVQRQIDEEADEQVALLEGPEQWIRAADWKPVDPEGTIAAGRIYSGEELATITRCTTLQEVNEQVPGAILPPGALNKPFVKQKRSKDGGAIFKADFQDLGIFEQLAFQGNGLLRYEIFGYDEVEVTPKRRKGQPAPTPQKVLKPRATPEQQTFFEKNGRTIDLPRIVKGKGKKRTETRAELTVKRKNLVGTFTQEAQADTVADLTSDQSEVVIGKSVADVWEQSNPNDFFQSLTFKHGAAKQLKPAYREVVRAFRAHEFTPLGTLSKEEQRRFNDVRLWISGLIGKVDGWAREGTRANVEDLLALEAAPAMCNVISYYLYGQLIGKIPKEKTFGQHVVEETRKGRIGPQITRTDDPNDKIADNDKDIVIVSGAYYGFGSGAWRKTFGLDVMTAEVPLTHQSRRKEFETFLNSDVRLAIAHQDVKGNGKPGHFHLIVKDKNGVWRNFDHTSQRFERRGGTTNFSKVYGVVFDKQALEEARAMVEQLEQQSAPVQVLPK